MEKDEGLSVVIPAHDSSATLPAVIEALKAELRPEDQLIVVDDRSSDNTLEVAGSLEAMVVSSDRSPGAAGTRNAGAEEADRPVILFVDSDAVVRAGWRQKVVHWMSCGGADAVQAIYAEEAPGRGAATFYKNYYYHYTFTRRIGNPWLTGCGTFFFAVDAELFRRVGGFDENVRGASIEDADLAARLTAAGGRIRLVPEIEVFHLRTYTLSGLLRYDWKMIIAKSMYLLRSGRGSRGEGPSLSMARPGELWAVSLGALLVWPALAALLLLPLSPRAVALPALLSICALILTHAGFWLGMIRAGGLRGLLACLITIPDLLLMVPAVLRSLFSFLVLRKRY
jgi:GT2 family glycosyltransferase